MNTINIELTPEQAAYLVDSLMWSLSATEKSLRRNPSGELRDKWQALDDVLAQVQEVKRDRWYGVDA